MSLPTAERPVEAIPPKSGGENVNYLTRLFTTKMGRIALGGVTLAGITVGVIAGMAGGGDKVAATPERSGVTLENSTPDQFWSDMFTDNERVQYADKLLHKQSNDPQYPGMTVEQAAYKRLNAKLVSIGRPELESLVSPSVSNTANEALVQETVVTAAATYAADSNAGEKILAAEVDDSNPGLETQREQVRANHKLSDGERLDTNFETSFVGPDAAASAAAGHSVEQVTTTISSGKPIGTITTEAGIPTRVAAVIDAHDMNHVSEDVQTFVGGRWVTKDVITPSASTWIPPQNLVNIKAK